jgi:ankyrin repeat protein
MHARLVEFTVILAIAGAAAIHGQPAGPADKAEAFAAAARRGDAAAVSKLLDEGVDVNSKYRYGATALSYAADHGRLDVVKVLLARGADVNVKDTFYGATPLTWASSPAQTHRPEHVEIVRLLLKAGATGIDAALQGAVFGESAATVKAILDHGGVSAAGLTNALEAAKKVNAPELVKLLEAAGAKPKG